jgi:hypothetical protein
MKKKARGYSADFKQDAVSRMAQATTIRLRHKLGLKKDPPYEGGHQLLHIIVWHMYV